MGAYQPAVQIQQQPVDGAMSPLCQRILDCAKEYISRQERLTHPAGVFDNAKRFSLVTKYPCCEDIRSPSRQFPYPEMTHGRSLQHLAHEYGVSQHLRFIRQVTNRLKKHGQADVEAFLRSPKALRLLLEADLNV